MPKDTWWNLPIEKRERITRAAMVEFGQRGFSAGSLNVVARESGIAKGSLFQYFDDKLDLFSTICTCASDDIRAAAVKGVDLDTTPYFDAVRAILPNWIGYFRKHPTHRGIAYAAQNEVDADARAAVRSVTNEQFVAVFRPMAKRAADNGELRPGTDLDQLVSMTILLLRHLNTAPFYDHAEPVLELTQKSPKEVERIARELVDGLQRGYGA